MRQNISRKTFNTLSRLIPIMTAAGLTLLSMAPATGYTAINDVQQEKKRPISQNITQQAKIQLAILLDTSGSMDGLIDQARNQLWQVVNEFSKARQNGSRPILEVAVYEYGNDGVAAKDGYIRLVSPLTSELDLVSEALFSLTTNGGNEYCGYAIQSATMNLQWSSSNSDIKSIFIAGNEPFTQGPIPFKQAIKLATAKGITVNTIHAGSYDEGTQGGWREGAVLAGGNYMSIDHNHKVAHVAAPQDRRIAELNSQLNETYIPYGPKGAAGESRQMMQDKKSDGVSAALLSKRAKSKATSFYNNSSWDLVDAMQSGKVNIEDVEAEALPEPMQKMSKPERQQHVQVQEKKRIDIKKSILALSKERDSYIAKKKQEIADESVPTVESALIGSIRKQGVEKRFVFVEE